MIKVIEAIAILGLLVFSFFLGVKYSDQIKERAGWLFETKEEEIELPSINSDGSVEIEIPAEENNQYNQEVIIEEDSAPAVNSSQNPAASDSSVPSEAKSKPARK